MILPLYLLIVYWHGMLPKTVLFGSSFSFVSKTSDKSLNHLSSVSRDAIMIVDYSFIVPKETGANNCFPGKVAGLISEYSFGRRGLIFLLSTR